jgi:5'(3')-deoxyribonucleotidase
MIKNVMFDMDGVLCDFEKKFREYHNVEGSLFEIEDSKFWPMVKEIPNFWESLELINGSKLLFSYAITRANVEILSAPSRHDNRCAIGKCKWLKDNLGEFDFPINLVRAKYKKMFANEETILIDDLEKNVNEFRENGGKAILFVNAEQALRELKIYMGE